ncbi:MAG: hypothetical protein CVT99_00800 [Bacteroidetes bacterium HGW-Bacteroidetes-16]|jgi:hypothetical protein|nr:MAG: hypothetical protein CVT99_00800 [Bacteroidetes bacterium HGW-Bacteroidetes-16]
MATINENTQQFDASIRSNKDTDYPTSSFHVGIFPKTCIDSNADYPFVVPWQLTNEKAKRSTSSMRFNNSSKNLADGRVNKPKALPWLYPY